MKYMLLIHQGTTPTPRDPEAWDDALRGGAERRLRRLPGAQRDARRDARACGMGAPETATTVRVAGRQDADHRRPVRRDQGGARRLLLLRGRRPRRGDRARGARSRRRGWAARSRSARSWSGSRPRAGLPRRVGPRPRRADRLPRRLRPRRGGRAGGVRDRRRALAARRRCPTTRGAWLRDDGAQPRDRPHPPRPHAGREDPPARGARGGGGRRWTRRRSPTSGSSSIFTCCHPALAHRGAGGADAAHARRADDRRDRARVPGRRRRRWPSGWCAPSARSRPPASRSACRPTTCCPTGWPRCSPSST